MGYYFYEDDGKKIIKEELLDRKAIEWANTFIKPKYPKEKWKRNPRLTSAQLRKFHVEAKELEERVRASDDFDRLRPLIKMLKSKVAYACPDNGRDRKIPLEFRQYIEEMVDHIEDAKDFKAFALCFESVVGFFYGLGGR